MTLPPTEVVQAFGLLGSPKPISGGRGLCFIVDQIVFKPLDDDAEAQWIAELASKLLQRLLHHIGFQDLSPQWTSSARSSSTVGPLRSFVSGTPIPHPYRSTRRFEDIFRASRAFHAGLADLVREKPAMISRCSDRYREADHVTWDEKRLEEVQNVNGEILAQFRPILDKLAHAKKPLSESVQYQLIHADLTGNVLFGEQPGEPPAIIDLTLYWRPVEYAEAIVVADGLAWHGAGRNLVEL